MKYRTEVVDAGIKTNAGKLEDVMNAARPGERLHSIVSFNDGGGYTGKWVVIFERPDQTLDAPTFVHDALWTVRRQTGYPAENYWEVMTPDGWKGCVALNAQDALKTIREDYYS